MDRNRVLCGAVEVTGLPTLDRCYFAVGDAVQVGDNRTGKKRGTVILDMFESRGKDSPRRGKLWTLCWFQQLKSVDKALVEKTNVEVIPGEMRFTDHVETAKIASLKHIQGRLRVIHSLEGMKCTISTFQGPVQQPTGILVRYCYSRRFWGGAGSDMYGECPILVDVAVFKGKGADNLDWHFDIAALEHQKLGTCLASTDHASAEEDLEKDLASREGLRFTKGAR